MRAAVVVCGAAGAVALWLQGAGGQAQGSVLDCIGNTPLLELRCLSAATGCRMLAKAEQANPGGSVKDRVALALVRQARAQGRLTAGATLVEDTGCNTGVGLALVGAVLGYRFVLTVPAGIALEA